MNSQSEPSIEQLVQSVSGADLAKALELAIGSADPTAALRAELVSSGADEAREHVGHHGSLGGAEPSTASLIEAVHSNSLDADLSDLIDAAPPSERLKFERVDRVARIFAEQVEREAQRICAEADSSGVRVSAAKIADRMVLPVGALHVEGVSDSITQLMVDAGYERHRYGMNGQSVFVNAANGVRFSVRGTDIGTPDESAAPIAGSLGGLLSTPLGLVRPLLEFAGVRNGDLVVDLGCGDARILIEAAQQFGARGIGVESEASVVGLARENVEAAGVRDHVEIIHGDAIDFDTSAADVVFAFVPPTAASALIRRVQPQLSAGSRLVVHEAAFIDWPVPPDTVDVLVSDDACEIADAGITVVATWQATPVTNEELIWLPLETEGDAAPIVALHVIGPQGSRWSSLSQHLGPGQPFYCLSHVRAALTPFELQAGEQFDDVAEIAVQYADAIKQRFPAQRVVLAGFCQGGVYGYEVAQLLRSANVEVDLVLMIMDAHAPLRERRDSWLNLARAGRASRQQPLVPYILGAFGRLNQIRRRYLVPRLQRRLELGQVWLADRFDAFETDAVATRRNVETVFANLESYTYLPYTGAVGVIRGLDDPLASAEGPSGWGELVSELDVRTLPVVSTGLLHEPTVNVTARTVRDMLDAHVAAT